MSRTAFGTQSRWRRPLRIPDVRRMWLSDLLSVLGDHAAIVALAVLVYDRSHSAVAVAVISAAAYVPAFGIGPLLSTYADRFAYRPVMIACDLFRAAAYLAVLIPGLPVAVIVVAIFLAHCATFPFGAARAAQLPHIAGNDYGAVQRLHQSTFTVGALIGYSMGGAIVAFSGARGAIAINAASFVLSAVLIARVSARVRTVDDTDGPARSAANRMLSGARSLRADPLIFWPAMMVTAAFVGTASAEAMAVVVARQLAPSSAAQASGDGGLLALLLTMPVVVALVATIVCPTEGSPRRLVRVSAWMAVGSHGLAVVSLPFMHHGRLGIVTAVVAYAALGASTAMTVPCVTVVARRLPADNRASVFSLLDSLMVAGQALGALLAGVAVAHFGVVNGVCLLLAPAIAVCAVGLSRLPAPAARHSATEDDVDLIAA